MEVILQHVTLILSSLKNVFVFLEPNKTHKLFTYNFQYHSVALNKFIYICNPMGVITRTPYFYIKNLVNLLLHDKLPNLLHSEVVFGKHCHWRR